MTHTDNLADLHGHKVGTLKASLAERILQSAGNVVVVSYDEETDAYSDLANGRVDGVLLDYPIALYYAAPNPALRLAGDPIGRIRYGIAMRKGDTELPAAGRTRRSRRSWTIRRAASNIGTLETMDADDGGGAERLLALHRRASDVRPVHRRTPRR